MFLRNKLNRFSALCAIILALAFAVTPAFAQDDQPPMTLAEAQLLGLATDVAAAPQKVLLTRQEALDSFYVQAPDGPGFKIRGGASVVVPGTGDPAPIQLYSQESADILTASLRPNASDDEVAAGEFLSIRITASLKGNLTFPRFYSIVGRRNVGTILELADLVRDVHGAYAVNRRKQADFATVRDQVDRLSGAIGRTISIRSDRTMQ